MPSRGTRIPGRPPGRSAAGSTPSGVEPAGRARRSQLISTYGIGSIVDLEKGSFMPMGLDDWESVTGDPQLVVSEPRLAARLQVQGFRLPPATEDLVPGRVNPRQSVPVVRFPRWHECPQCHRLGVEGDPFALSQDGNRLECAVHRGRVIVTPVRFVLACPGGHIDDFPWVWWAHRGGRCEHPLMELRSHGRSAALSDLFVKCRSCGQSASLGDAFRPERLKGLRCHGVRPWLHDRQDCNAPPRVLQRGASNLHFPVVATALSIPPVSEGLFQIIDHHWLVLRAIGVEALPQVIAQIALEYDVPAASLQAALDERWRIEGGGEGTRTDAYARAEEYAALGLTREETIEGGVVSQFCNEVHAPPPALKPWFDLVGAVSRLREVRVLAGFSRIEPYPVSAERITQAIQEGRIAKLSKTPKNWLPAAEIRGEGLFLRFRGEAVDAWIAANPRAVHRAGRIDRRAADLAAARNLLHANQVTPRLLLAHSFAHALLRTISIECGYSSSALRERIYVREPEGHLPALHGLLIYTGSPDSEGSLGGLVRLAEPSRLEGIVRKTLITARWCGSDPVCGETDPAQAGDRISGAACHACLLVPETACEKFNRELDRTMLTGHVDAGGAWAGYFDGLED